MTDPIVLEVVGTPQPQGSKTGFVNKATGKVRMVEGRRGDARDRFHSWRDAVSIAARDWQAGHNVPLLDEPLRLTCVFRLPRPKTAPKKRVWPQGRPDLDKLTRTVGDALTGIIFTDDSRICDLRVTKTYAVDGPPGCTITVEVLDAGA